MKNEFIDSISVYKEYGPDRTLKFIFYEDRSFGIGLYLGREVEYEEIRLTPEELEILVREVLGRYGYDPKFTTDGNKGE